ncbi:MAG: DUF3810 family protein [Acidobacteria bacterium]|nr:DUF3810 family protein [Acidobacteriota bacterium]
MRCRVAFVVVALAAALAPVPAMLVDRFYTRGPYRFLQALLTSASNLAPFALFDVLLIAVAVAWTVLATRDVRRSGLRGVVAIAARTLVWISAIYLTFLVAWGLNYRGVRLIDALGVDRARVSPDALRRAADLAVARVNTLRDRAYADGWLAAGTIEPELAGAFARAMDAIGRRPLVVARPKRTLIDWYFQRAAVSGMTDPFFLETLVAGDLLPFERPFVIAHEWSHLAGLTDEGDANFGGWLACVRGSAGDQYSGWLFLYEELASASGGRERARLAAALAAGPREDLAAVRDRLARHVNRRVAAAGWRVYDSYLKANRVEAGAASYAEVVRLVLGARLPNGRAPLDDPQSTLQNDRR